MSKETQKSLSRAERVILTLTGCVLCFLLGWFLRGATFPSFSLSVETLPARSTVSASNESTQTDAATADTESLPAADENVTQESPLVNINTADAQELMTLPNIGETRAESIIAYREANGPFELIEHLTEVSGIGEKIFASVEPYITVE